MQSTDSESNQMATSESSDYFGKHADQLMAAAATSTGVSGQAMLQNGHAILGGSTTDSSGMQGLLAGMPAKSQEESMDMWWQQRQQPTRSTVKDSNLVFNIKTVLTV